MKCNERWELTAFQLKCIAIVTMALDHIGAVLYPEQIWLRCIGRLSFPIFCFLLVEGIAHTRSVKNYLIRLGVFALLSEIPYDLAFQKEVVSWERQNVFFTLFLGAAMLWGMSRAKRTGEKWALLVLAMAAADILRADYGWAGILLIAVWKMTKEYQKLGYFAGMMWNFLWGLSVQCCGAAAVISLRYYRGQKGRSMKYFFYLFYPLHLLLLYGIWRMRIQL